MAGKAKRVALYLRVSTDGQTVENQRRDLDAAAAQRGWVIVATYADEGVSGAKGRDKRPGLDGMLKDAVRGRFDVAMCWAVDRMGRSLADLVGTLQELRGAKVDLFLHQQAIDTTTPAGEAMFGMLGVFAQFERSMIVARVKAGLERVRGETPAQRKAKGKQAIGRPRVADATEDAIRGHLAAGTGVRRWKVSGMERRLRKETFGLPRLIVALQPLGDSLRAAQRRAAPSRRAGP